MAPAPPPGAPLPPEPGPERRAASLPGGGGSGAPALTASAAAWSPPSPAGVNLHLAAALAGLYGSEAAADCDILFCSDGDGGDPWGRGGGHAAAEAGVCPGGLAAALAKRDAAAAGADPTAALTDGACQRRDGCSEAAAAAADPTADPKQPAGGRTDAPAAATEAAASGGQSERYAELDAWGQGGAAGCGCGASTSGGADPAAGRSAEGGGGVRARARARALGPALPAHALVLRLASERFAAQLDRWALHEPCPPGPGPSGGSSSPGTCSYSASAAAAAPRAGGRRPLLRVPVGCEGELRGARAAIRFAYTGQVHAASVREALELRRAGDYLAIEGCAAAAVRWLAGRLLAEAPPPAAGAAAAAAVGGSGGGGGLRQRLSDRGGGGRAPSAGLMRPLEAAMPPPTTHAGAAAAEPPAVLQLYACEELWPACEDRRFAALLASARRLLVSHFRSAIAALNTPPLRRQLLALPASGIQALLESGSGSESESGSGSGPTGSGSGFGTDSEDTVLALLAAWKGANWARTDAACRQRLCGLIRLPLLSHAISSCILPCLAADYEIFGSSQPAGWFPITAVDAAFAACYAGAAAEQQGAMLRDRQAAGSPGWAVATPRPQCIPDGGSSSGGAGAGGEGGGGGGGGGGGLSFPFSISRETLAARLRAAQYGEGAVDAYGTYDSGEELVIARGLSWRVSVDYARGEACAGVFLWCRIPAAFQLPGSRLCGPLPRFPAAVDARVVIYRWRGGRREEAYSRVFDRAGAALGVDHGLGNSRALPLALPQAHQAQPWAQAQIHQAQAQAQAQAATEAAVAVPGVAAGLLVGAGAGLSGGAVGAAGGDPMEPWAEYLGPDGRVRGCLTLLRPS